MGHTGLKCFLKHNKPKQHKLIICFNNILTTIHSFYFDPLFSLQQTQVVTDEGQGL